MQTFIMACGHARAEPWSVLLSWVLVGSACGLIGCSATANTGSFDDDAMSPVEGDAQAGGSTSSSSGGVQGIAASSSSSSSGGSGGSSGGAASSSGTGGSSGRSSGNTDDSGIADAASVFGARDARVRDAAAPPNAQVGTTSGGEGGAAIGYAANIAGILRGPCSGCHRGSGGLTISFANLVNVKSGEVPAENYVTPGAPGSSYLFCKMSPNDSACAGMSISGSAMPPGGMLSATNLNEVKSWIQQGAAP